MTEQQIKDEILDILDEYGTSVSNAMNSRKYKEKPEVALKQILKLIEQIKTNDTH